MRNKTGPKLPAFHPEYSLLPETALRANQIGSPMYYTGKPCVRGHLSPRYASSANCIECIEQKRKIAGRNMRGGSKFRTQAQNELALKALEKGQKTYVGKACPKGHVERQATTGNCIECVRLANLKRKEYAKWKRIFDLYGLTQDDINRMITEQKNECKICSTHFSKLNMHIDHCHKTGKVRSLLCSKCNQAIGLIDESVERAEKIKQYLRGHHGT